MKLILILTITTVYLTYNYKHNISIKDILKNGVFTLLYVGLLISCFGFFYLLRFIFRLFV